MNIKGLIAFTLIIDHGSLSAASRIMHLSPSAVSRQIGQLEAELGFQLFRRDRQNLVPTEMGQTFYSEAQRILAGLRQLPEIARGIARYGRQRLHVMTMPKFAPTLGARVAAEFSRRYPEVQIKLDIEQRRYLDRGAAGLIYDVGIVEMPFHQPDLTVRSLGKIAVVVLVPASHRLAGRTSVNLAELREDRLISTTQDTMNRKHVERAFQTAGMVPSVHIETSSTLVVGMLVAEGAGYALTEALALPNLDRSKVAVLYPDPPISTEVGLVTPRHGPKSELVKAFCETAETAVPEYLQTLPAAA